MAGLWDEHERTLLRNAYEDAPRPDTGTPESGRTTTVGGLIGFPGTGGGEDASDHSPEDARSDEADAPAVPEWFKPRLPVDREGRILPPTPGDPRYNADGSIKRHWLDPELAPLWSFQHLGWDPKTGDFFLYKDNPEYHYDDKEGRWVRNPQQPSNPGEEHSGKHKSGHDPEIHKPDDIEPPEDPPPHPQPVYPLPPLGPSERKPKPVSPRPRLR
jgi:hypothetical protein